MKKRISNNQKGSRKERTSSDCSMSHYASPENMESQDYSDGNCDDYDRPNTFSFTMYIESEMQSENLLPSRIAINF
jgi:hypothetical protein